MDKGSLSIILKVTNLCNLRCSFCRYSYNNYYDSLSDYDNMSIKTAMDTINKAALFNINNKVNHLHLIFHGGEPLLWGKSNFLKILEYQKYFCTNHLNFEFYNSIQTNALLLDEEWIDIFKNNNFEVGISIDGPEPLNFHHYNTNLEKIKLLQQSEINYGILSVVTNLHADKAQEYYQFLIDNNIHNIGFCYCYDPIANNTVTNTNLSKFLIEFFDLYFFNDYELHVREFEEIFNLILRKPTISCNYCFRKKCGNYLSVFPNSDVLFCDSYEKKDKILGNLINNDFNKIITNINYKKILKQNKNNFNSNCKNCEYLQFCGGGCFRNDRNDTTNQFCETYINIYKHIKNTLNHFIGDEL